MTSATLLAPTQATLEPRYTRLLNEWCASQSELALTEARALAETFVEAGLQAAQVVAIHESAAEEVIEPNDASQVVGSQKFLLEVMIAFGDAYAVLTERLRAATIVATASEQTRADDSSRADDERLELLAGVSHELGSPLMVVKGNLLAIRRTLEDGHSWSDELSQRADDCEFALDRMLALREELLAASRNEERALELVPLHLSHCLHRVVRWARAGAAEKNIGLTETGSATVPYISGDESAVQSVFSNLLSNAIRYTPAGGTINVAMSTEGPFVVAEVTDTGIGMSAAERQRIFERFYRTPGAQKMASFGLGLGLAITRDLVTAMGGTIEVASRAGAGSTFKVSLPAMDMADSAV